MIENHAPFYHTSINAAQYNFDPFVAQHDDMNPTKPNYDNLVNQSGSTLDDSNLKEGESMLDGSDSYSGSDKSRDQYARQKV